MHFLIFGRIFSDIPQPSSNLAAVPFPVNEFAVLSANGTRALNVNKNIEYPQK